MTTVQNKPSALLQPVIDDLASKISSGQLQPGQRISPLRKLARDYKVSYGAAQRAIDQLERDGLLTRQHGSGTFVRDDLPSYSSSEKSHWVCMLVNHLQHTTGTLLSTLTHRLQEKGLVPATYQIDNDQKFLGIEDLARRIKAKPPRAIVVQGAINWLDDLLEMWSRRTRIIGTLRTTPTLHCWHSVNPDPYGAARLGGNYLMQQGHRRIGLVLKARMANPRWPQTRRKAWMWHTRQILGLGDAMRKAGLSDGLSLFYNRTRQTGVSSIPIDPANQQALGEWLKKAHRPTAVMGDDYRLLGVRLAAEKLGLTVGRDLTLLPLGDHYTAELHAPAYVSLQHEKVADRIAEMVLNTDASFNETAHHLVVSPVLNTVDQRTEQFHRCEEPSNFVVNND